jgi:hypothetical protein
MLCTVSCFHVSKYDDENYRQEWNVEQFTQSEANVTIENCKVDCLRHHVTEAAKHACLYGCERPMENLKAT